MAAGERDLRAAHPRAARAPRRRRRGRLYLHILRDLRRIHSHLGALAYPVLERAGLLRDRLCAATPRDEKLR